MDLGIRGRRAAVAAGTAGLGRATARALAAEGVAVAVCGRDRERLDAAVADLRSSGAEALGVIADLADTHAATSFVSEAAAGLGGTIDILVANAGGPPAGDFGSTSLKAYRHALELNCLSTIAMCQAAVPAMREQRWGRVVAVTSIGAREPIGNLVASSVARAAVTSFLKVLSREVAPDGVTVNSVQPGIHATDRMVQLRGTDDPAKLGAHVPVGHLGDPEGFGAVAAFLCSEHARFVTGTGLPVDGGASHGLLS